MASDHVAEISDKHKQLQHTEEHGKEQAWDEGYNAAYHQARLWGTPRCWEDPPTNPYRADQIED